MERRSGRKPLERGASQKKKEPAAETASSEDDEDDTHGEVKVKEIIAMCDSSAGRRFLLVRWATDDDGKAYAPGKETETWEPEDNVSARDLVSKFTEVGRRPLEEEVAAMTNNKHKLIATVFLNETKKHRRYRRS